MTKQQYFDMCDMLGSEPLDEEIPVELEDLPELVQTAFIIYETLRDEWDYMGGNYIGKNQQNLFHIFKLYKVLESEYMLVYKILNIIDGQRREIIRASKN